MNKFINILIFCLTSEGAMSCGETNTFEFGMYTQEMRADGSYIWEETFGESVTSSKTEVRINLNFLSELAASPNGETLKKNREELIYLISSGNERATVVGLQVLDHLIREPKFTRECETDYELYGKEELAFTLGRSGKVYNALCRLNRSSLIRILSLYEERPELWGLVYDPPWHAGNLECHPHNNHRQSDAKGARIL